MTETRSFTREVGGRTLTIETGNLAWQAGGEVTVRYGDSVVLVTACMSSEPREGVDFLPLTVDYEERLYAAGKIPGGFIRREGRPSQEATLASRLIDRSIRPLLPKTWRNEIQVIVTVLSADQENDPNIMAVIGSSTALAMSEVPFDGPIHAVNIGYINGEMVLNPLLSKMAGSQLDLVVSSTRQAVVMIEAGAKEVSEDIMTRAIKFAHEANLQFIEIQEEVVKACGRAKLPVSSAAEKSALLAAISQVVSDEQIALALAKPDKVSREDSMKHIKQTLTDHLKEQFGGAEITGALDARIKAVMRNNVLGKSKRFDGRSLTEVRPITCKVGLLPRTHGSGLFSRGETQVLTIATLGSMSEKQQIDGLGLEETRRYMHHYNFPPFSTGETKRVGVPGRREIGHGALAERAILPVIPGESEFPYTIRLVSEVLSSSGSTSMGSTCACSLSLMDAGIPIKKAVSGIAMGLITDDQGKYAVLTDIAGFEDAYGDMDYKIAGTVDGITALQLDIKLKGVSLEILEKAMWQAREARLFIMDIMNKTISAPRPEMSPYAPRMYKITINPDKIGAVIGSGGKTIRAIIEETKSTIDISDDGTVIIGSNDEQSARKAIGIIEGLTKDVEVGTIYTGKVTRILNFGAMVEILPGKEGLVHISELADYRVGKVEDVVKVGEEITVKVIDIDNMNRVNLSRKAVLTKPGQPSSSRPEGEGQSMRQDSRGGGPRRRDDRPPFRRP